MGWRFYRRLRPVRFLNLNLSGSGVGWSIGIPGLRYGVDAFGRRYFTLGLPGTGIRYMKYLKTRALPTVDDNRIQHWRDF